MDRGFLDSSDKTKKKDGGVKVADKKDGGSSKVGVSKDAAPAAPILGDIAKRVKSIDGVINVPKSILRKVARIVSTDVQEGDKTLNIEGSGSKVRFEDVGKVSADSSTQVSGNSTLGPVLMMSSNGVATNNDGAANDGLKTGGSFASLLRPNKASNKVHFCTLVNEERVESIDCVLPKAAAAKVKGRYENSIVGFFLGKDPSFLVVQQIFFNQSKYIKEMLKKFGLEYSKPSKTLMSTEIKLTNDDEADSVDSSKYQ
nr:zinc knuckle CX2CX4HX4C [Tanacetum cinerariifolium]